MGERRNGLDPAALAEVKIPAKGAALAVVWASLAPAVRAGDIDIGAHTVSSEGRASRAESSKVGAAAAFDEELRLRTRGWLSSKRIHHSAHGIAAINGGSRALDHLEQPGLRDVDLI